MAGERHRPACAWSPVLLPWQIPVTKVAFVGGRCDFSVWLGLTLVSWLLGSQGGRRQGFGMCVQCLHRHGVRVGSLVAVLIICNELCGWQGG